jgi:hypothetical protein
MASMIASILCRDIASTVSSVVPGVIAPAFRYIFPEALR